MNETLLLILAYLPVIANSGLFVVIAKFISKQLKNHFSIPEKTIKELKELRGGIAALNSQCANLIEENRKLCRKNEALTMQLRGVKDYDKEDKKN